MPSDPRTTLLKLLDALRDLDVKRDAIYAEMDILLKGGEGVGPKLNRLKKAYAEAWQAKWKSKYTFTNHAVPAQAFKKFLMAGHTETEIIARMFTYMKDDASFYVNARHPFEIFAKSFNSFVGLPPSAADVNAEAATKNLRELRGDV